jgi:hypothetical protein
MTVHTAHRPTPWASVTLAQFAALDILRSPDGLAAVDRYWDAMHAHPANIYSERPTRLTEAGLAWFAALRAELAAGAYLAEDATDAVRIAEDCIRGLGLLTVMGTRRLAEGGAL